MERKRLCAVFAFLLLLSATSAAAKDKWIHLRSPHFEAYSNASERKSEKLLAELEQFRFVFYRLFGLDGTRQLPVRVMIFKNKRSFDPFKPLHDGKPAALAGFFQQGGDYNLIAMEESSGGDSLRTIFHEYVHLLTSGLKGDWPIWLNEGMAEFYSTFRISGDKVVLGSPINEHAELLRRRTLLSLENLFEVGLSSPEYNEKDKKGVFYAQSWAMVHFLMMDGKTARRPQLSKYIQLVESGRGALEAAKEAFPETIEELQRELRNYVHQASVYALTVQMQDIEEAKTISTARIDEAAALARLGDLLLHINRLEEASEFYNKALAADPASSEPYEGMGLLAMRQGDHEKAQSLLEKAAGADSANFLVHLYYGQSLMRAAGVFEPGETHFDDETYRKAATHLRRASELMPSSAEALYLLAHLHLAARRDLDEGIAQIRQALRLKAGDENYLTALADLQLEARDWTGARETLRKLDSLGSLSAREQAESRLDYLQYLEDTRRAAEAVGIPKTAATPGNAPAGTRPPPGESSGGEAEPLPPRKARCHPDFTHLDGSVPVSGRLLRVECESGIVYVVDFNGREQRLVGEKRDQPVVFSCEVSLKTFQCGPLPYPVTVFLPGNLPKDETTGASVVRAIELKAGQ